MLSAKARAGVTQLVECQLPKLNVAGSIPVSRSTKTPLRRGFEFLRRAPFTPAPTVSNDQPLVIWLGARHLARITSQPDIEKLRGAEMWNFARAATV
jgi:hypothetical protein